MGVITSHPRTAMISSPQTGLTRNGARSSPDSPDFTPPEKQEPGHRNDRAPVRVRLRGYFLTAVCPASRSSFSLSFPLLRICHL